MRLPILSSSVHIYLRNGSERGAKRRSEQNVPPRSPVCSDADAVGLNREEVMGTRERRPASADAAESRAFFESTKHWGKGIMEVVQKRNLSVSYSKTTENLWLVSADLADEQHNITAKLEIDIPSLTISGASVEFIKYPLAHCLEVAQKAKDLIGCSVFHELSQRLDELFSGPEGCPNARNLFGISGPGFIYTYYPHLIKEGRMKPEDWWKIVGTELRNDCIAHKRMAEMVQGKDFRRKARR
jgi:hypothetical protein